MSQNLLIIDDEYYVLKWLEEMFRFEFEEEVSVYTASSAEDALELLNQRKFDVVLTDICMPGMDGIELFEEIKKNWPRCKTVFLTGFRDFDHMYRIRNHRDVRYILKSEDDSVIKQAVKESLQAVEKELEQEIRQQKLEKDWQQVQQWLKDEFMGHFLHGKLQTEQVIHENRQEAGISFPFEKDFLVFLVCLMPEGRLQEHYKVQRQLEFGIGKCLPEDIKIFTHSLSETKFLLFFQSSFVNPNQNRVFAIAQGAVDYTQNQLSNLGIILSILISSTWISAKTLPGHLQHMQWVMDGYLEREEGAIAHLECIDMTFASESELSVKNTIAVMQKNLTLHQRKEYFQHLAYCGEKLTERTSMHDIYALELYFSLAVMLLQFINENRLNEKIAFEIGVYKLTKVDEHQSWDEALQYLFDLSRCIFDLMGEEVGLPDYALKKIRQYIDGHFSEELSLTVLAELGGFNASYLSRIFKQKYKMTISEYINQNRMKLARKLLTETEKKIQEIAVETGYLSAHSFYRAFRREENISPEEYRALHSGRDSVKKGT